jgi:hypothetical protein
VYLLIGFNSKVCVMQLKKMSVIVTITLIIAIVAALSGCTNTASPSPTAAPAGGDLAAGLPATLDYNVKLTGGSTPVTLTYADLRGMGLKELKGVSVVNSVGTETSGDYVGVPLMDIVNKAGLPAGEFSFRAFASDGYKLDYTAEQFAGGILALKTNGEANTAGFNDRYPISFVFPSGEKSDWLKMPVEIVILPGSVESTALFISGENVTSKPTFTLSGLKNMTQKTISATDSKNNTANYTGVSLNDLLDKAGPRGVNVTFISGDASGYSKNVTLAYIQANDDVIVAIDENGVLRDIIPGQPSNTWVGNLTKIRVD